MRHRQQPQLESNAIWISPMRNRGTVSVTLLSVAFLVLFAINKGVTDESHEANKKLPQGLVSRDGKIYGEKDNAEMVLIPASEFQMGTSATEIQQLVEWAKQDYPDIDASAFESETPCHTVYLDAFYIDVYEVTNAQYQKFMNATGQSAPRLWDNPLFNAPSQPVVGVSWHDAIAYAKWAGKRLPTEAEWEKAARGGLTGKRFPWGDALPEGTQCNFADKNRDLPWSDRSLDDGYQYASPVGTYPPNGYGLYDMAGNVWEWCADWYDTVYYQMSPVRNPQGPHSGESRLLRGGSWSSHRFILRAAFRDWIHPDSWSNDWGFRCVFPHVP